MIKRSVLIAALLMFLLLASSTVYAGNGGFPWQDHAAPFDFKFNNLIDNHQQSKLVERDMLQGFIYIQFTGEEIDGIPTAVRADCESPGLDCRVGWKIKGIPFSAMLVSEKPRVWLVDESLLPASSHHLHFHWINTPKKPCKLETDQTYDGFLLQRTATAQFYWLGGNPANSHGGRLVSPGMDLHSNIVTEWDGSNSNHDGGHDDGGHDDGGHDDGGHDDGGHDDGGHDDGMHDDSHDTEEGGCH